MLSAALLVAPDANLTLRETWRSDGLIPGGNVRDGASLDTGRLRVERSLEAVAQGPMPS